MSNDENQSSNDRNFDDACPAGLTEKEWGDMVLSLLRLATVPLGNDPLTLDDAAHANQLAARVYEQLGIIRKTEH